MCEKKLGKERKDSEKNEKASMCRLYGTKRIKIITQKPLKSSEETEEKRTMRFKRAMSFYAQRKTRTYNKRKKEMA